MWSYCFFCFKRTIFITDWVTDPIEIRRWTLFFHSRSSETILRSPKRKTAFIMDGACERLAYFWHSCVQYRLEDWWLSIVFTRSLTEKWVFSLTKTLIFQSILSCACFTSDVSHTIVDFLATIAKALGTSFGEAVITWTWSLLSFNQTSSWTL